jgi:hypothetical protein
MVAHLRARPEPTTLVLFVYMLVILLLRIFCRNFFCNEIQLDALFILNLFLQKPLHVSGVFIANHQEVLTVYVQQLVRVIRLSD